MVKPIEESFVDWESHVFGSGYGTGDQHVLRALKVFLENVSVAEDDRGMRGYDHEKIELALGPAVTWLLINILCKHDILDYGTSPRFGWLSPEGEALKAFLATKTVDELVELCCGPGEHDYCWPGGCNCGPQGFDRDRRCPNPFWVCR